MLPQECMQGRSLTGDGLLHATSCGALTTHTLSYKYRACAALSIDRVSTQQAVTASTQDMYRSARH